MRVHSPFHSNDPADLPAFLAGLRGFIDQHNHPGVATGVNPAADWQDALAQITGPVSQPIALMLDFLGGLHADGLFDPLLDGVGQISAGNTYTVAIEDLSQLDPHARAVSFMRFKKGNPWFGFELDEIGGDAPRPRVYSRRVRKKKVEITWDLAGLPPNIPLFLWRWFAQVTAKPAVQFGDAPNLASDAFTQLEPLFETALIWPNKGALFVDDNAAVSLSFSSIGWMSNIVIPDATAPHGLSPAVLDVLDLDPAILADLIDRQAATPPA